MFRTDVVKRSYQAIDNIIGTIAQLQSINNDIDSLVVELENQRLGIDHRISELTAHQENNQVIIDNYKNLINIK